MIVINGVFFTLRALCSPRPTPAFAPWRLALRADSRASVLAEAADLRAVLLQLPEDSIGAISGDLKKRNLSLSLLKSLFEEANASYIKSNKRAALHAELPFSEEKYSMLQPILPPEKFLPPAYQW